MSSSAIIVHGGAGVVPDDRHAQLREGCRRAAEVGDAILVAGGSALDAVVAAVRVLEDDPEYNAGTGSALTREGRVETDASIMDGATQRVGAVAAVPDLGNAIALARAVLDANEHVILAGSAAWKFASSMHIRPAPTGTLVTERARERLAAFLEGRAKETSGGTVGAVARDQRGRFAAATSTGGIVGKRTGRVGDSPIPGAGTWADTRCALSATGDGEAILRVALTRSIALRCELTGASLRDATIESLLELARITGLSAGVIGVDARGVIGLQLTATMPIASIIRGDSTGTTADSMGEQVEIRSD
ncbi:MAG TPA: isoaspartyl peptidase/L-asparaginase [Kofleriaceae bacterium]|nr:isoaspartyl peptidase/L-asparaginase [Kofleriaceae bacterium]